MAVRPCCPRIAAPYRRFHYDVKASAVEADFEFDDRLAGPTAAVPHRVILAILDQAMAWSSLGIAKRFTVAKDTTVRFDRPVRMRERHHVRAWIAAADEREVLLESPLSPRGAFNVPAPTPGSRRPELQRSGQIDPTCSAHAKVRCRPALVRW